MKWQPKILQNSVAHKIAKFSNNYKMEYRDVGDIRKKKQKGDAPGLLTFKNVQVRILSTVIFLVWG